MVKRTAQGGGFVLVRPLSKRTRVGVGAVLEARGARGEVTAELVRSAEGNRRFFTADIRGGEPSEGDAVFELPRVPGDGKLGALAVEGRAPTAGIDLSEPLSLPPLRREDIEAMEP